MILSLIVLICCSHEMNQIRGGSYIDSPDWIKKAAINPINKNDKNCFQYAATLVLNHKEIGKDSGRITKIEHFIDKYSWQRINYPSEKDVWKNFKKNNLKIVNVLYLNFLYIKNKKIYPAYMLKHNPKSERLATLLLIPSREGWHCNAVKKTVSIVKRNNVKKKW